jgi:nitronate monooxygenase
MALTTALTRRVGIAHPIVQAPMAGGGDTPALAAAGSEAGGLSPEQIADAAAKVRALTPRPFGINLFTPTPIAPLPEWSAAARALAGYHAELGLPPPQLGDHGVPDFDAQLAAALDSEAGAISFVFGIPDAAALAAVKARGRVLIGTATTVAEARQWERAGADLIVAQGAEAGGHRGSFAVPFEQGLVGTLALVPQVVDAVRLPVLAAGGVMDGRGLAAALMLGAAGVQMGPASAPPIARPCRRAPTTPRASPWPSPDAPRAVSPTACSTIWPGGPRRSCPFPGRTR